MTDSPCYTLIITLKKYDYKSIHPSFPVASLLWPPPYELQEKFNQEELKKLIDIIEKADRRNSTPIKH